MNKLISIFVFCLSFQSVSFGFETTAGNYLAQQDVLQTLSDIFFAESLPANPYGLRGCVVYRTIFDDASGGNLDELGFNNIESGEKLIHQPDVTYVLRFDFCISKILSDDASWTSIGFKERVLGEAGVQWSVAEAKSESIGYSFISRIESKYIPLQVREKIVEYVFSYVFASPNLIPSDYLQESKKALLLESDVASVTFLQFLESVYKKAIINDYFLKY